MFCSSHNMLEKMFHPDLFQITRCSRGPNNTQCERGDFCAFAHSEEELRYPSSSSNAQSAKDKTASGGGRSYPLSLSLSPFDSDQHQRHHQRSPSGGGAGTLSPYARAEGLSPSKPLTVDSAALENIQNNLVTLIKSQGADGIISSELPKRYFDHFGTRLDLQDEHGEKFRIKDILHKRSDVAVSMHKGVQPKYVYSGPDPSPGPPSRAGRGAGIATTAIVKTSTTLEDVEETKGGTSLLSFLAAASGSPPLPLESREQNREQEKWPVADVHHTTGGNTGGQPAFSPSGIGVNGSGGGSGNRHGDREDYLHSPFFPDTTSSSPCPPDSSSSKDGLNGLLGNSTSSSNHSLTSSLLLGGDINTQNDFNAGLISPPRHRDTHFSSSSYLESTFKFPLGFSDNSDQNDHEDAQHLEFSRVLNDKNSELKQKTLEIENLKSKLQDFQRMHHEVCLEHDKEKRHFQAQITQLTEKCSSVTEDNQSREFQFPQNAFPMSSSRQPFSPQRSVSSTSSTSSPLRSWTGDNNNSYNNNSGGFGYNHRNQQPQHSSSSRCGHQGCTSEGTYWCSGCSRVGYCGPQHQAAHWELHKHECGNAPSYN